MFTYTDIKWEFNFTLCLLEHNWSALYFIFIWSSCLLDSATVFSSLDFDYSQLVTYFKREMKLGRTQWQSRQSFDLSTSILSGHWFKSHVGPRPCAADPEGAVGSQLRTPSQLWPLQLTGEWTSRWTSSVSVLLQFDLRNHQDKERVNGEMIDHDDSISMWGDKKKMFWKQIETEAAHQKWVPVSWHFKLIHYVI